VKSAFVTSVAMITIDAKAIAIEIVFFIFSLLHILSLHEQGTVNVFTPDYWRNFSGNVCLYRTPLNVRRMEFLLQQSLCYGYGKAYVILNKSNRFVKEIFFQCFDLLLLSFVGLISLRTCPEQS